MHWLTPSALKSQVIRAFNSQKFATPPPAGFASLSSSTSVALDVDPLSKSCKRPIYTSLKYMKEKEKEKEKKQQIAKKEITQLRITTK